MNDEVYIWYADKDQTFLKVDTIIWSVHSQACSKYPN